MKYEAKHNAHFTTGQLEYLWPDRPTPRHCHQTLEPQPGGSPRPTSLFYPPLSWILRHSVCEASCFHRRLPPLPVWCWGCASWSGFPWGWPWCGPVRYCPPHRHQTERQRMHHSSWPHHVHCRPPPHPPPWCGPLCGWHKTSWDTPYTWLWPVFRTHRNDAKGSPIYLKQQIVWLKPSMLSEYCKCITFGWVFFIALLVEHSFHY